MASLGIHRLLTPSTRTTPRLLVQTLLPKNAGRNLSHVLRYSTATASPSTLPAAQPKTESVLPDVKGPDGATDWSRSYSGLSTQPFSAEISAVLQAPIDEMDVEMKPGESGCFQCVETENDLHSYSKIIDGLIYLPEIKYRRILNKAFGPGGWGLAPRTETNVGPKIVSREYALVCLGRYGSLPIAFLVTGFDYNAVIIEGWSRLLEESKNISILQVLPLLQRHAKVML